MDPATDPATANNFRALRTAVSGDPNGLTHHTDKSLSRFLRAKKNVEAAAKLLIAYEDLVEDKGWRDLKFEDVEEFWNERPLLCWPDVRDKDGRTCLFLNPRIALGKLKPEEMQRFAGQCNTPH